MKVNTTNINLGTAYNINIPMKKKKNEGKHENIAPERMKQVLVDAIPQIELVGFDLGDFLE